MSDQAAGVGGGNAEEEENDQFILVIDPNDNEQVALPLNPDGTLSLTTLSYFFPGAYALKYAISTTAVRHLVPLDAHLLNFTTPSGGWKGKTFYVVFRPQESIKELKERVKKLQEKKKKLDNTQLSAISSFLTNSFFPPYVQIMGHAIDPCVKLARPSSSCTNISSLSTSQTKRKSEQLENTIKTREKNGRICAIFLFIGLLIGVLGVQDGQIAGRALLIVGEPGTGKSSKSLGGNTPFISISASEVFSVDVSKPEALTKSFRKAIGVRIKEETGVLCREFVRLEIDRPQSGAGPRVGKLTLKRTDMEAIYDIGNKMTESVQDIKAWTITGKIGGF